MMKSPLNIISIGYAKRIFSEGSRERERMKKYSELTGNFHVIIFTNKKENLPKYRKVGNLHLYATNSVTALGKIFSAIQIGRKIISQNKFLPWIITSQDPFETSFVGLCISVGHSAICQVQIHGDVFNPVAVNSYMQKVRVIFGKWYIKRVLHIRVVSKRIEKSLLELGVPASKIYVLPIESDLGNFISVATDRVYNTNGNLLSFVYVGRFSPEKNLPMLLNSFSEIFRYYSGVKLTLIGDGPERCMLEELIRKKGLQKNIHFRPWQDNIALQYLEFDVLCLSSNHEGWGMVLVEALASGMPVITTDVGCAGELVKNDKNGLIVGVGNIGGFIAAIKKYIDSPNLLRTHGKSGHESVYNFYKSDTNYAKKMVDLWASYVI